MSITIKDIAARLDLNFSSVSRALNNKPGVSEETRRLVKQTAEEMRYQPNNLAKDLVSRSTNTIGVIMPDIINPVFGEITTGVIKTAEQHGYDAFICITNWDEEKEENYLHTLFEKQVAGIILKTARNDLSKQLRSAEVPVVGFESWYYTHDFSSVGTDNERAGYIAGKHLIECGYKKTAVLPGPQNSNAALQRCKGFFHACDDYGLEPDDSLLLYGKYNIESGYEIFSRLFENRPDIDSVMGGNDVIAMGVLKYLKEKNIKAGSDIGIIGFDDITFSSLPKIELTTVKQQKFSIGRIMSNLLFEEIKDIKNGLSYYPQRILLEPELVVRNTTRKIKTL